MKDDVSLVALTRDRAAAVAGVTERQIDYWARTGLVVPSVDHRLTPQRPIRLYGYVDLMSLMVIREFLARGVSLQAIRRIVDGLRDRGYGLPLVEVSFAISDWRVYYQLRDGSWEGGDRPKQGVIRETLLLEPLRASIRRATERDEQTVGQVERRRGALGFKPLVAGTRVPVETIRRYLENGRSVPEILKSFPVLRHGDVEEVRRGLSA